MNKILACTALVMIMAGGVQAASPTALNTYQAQPSDIRASEFIGQRVYATEAQIAADASVTQGAEKDWDDIGEINEVILGRDGGVKAVIVGVGGFLGIGEKNVAVPIQQVKFVRDGDAADDYFLVLNASKQLLTDAPAYVPIEPAQTAANNTGAETMTAPLNPDASNTTADATKPMDGTAANDAMTTGSTTPTAPDADRTLLTRPDVVRDGYQAAQISELTADKLTGATVYGPKDENVGEINRLVLSADGKIERVVLDVGGFLGMGERQIAVTMDELTIVRNAAGDDVRVYIDANKANLEAQPEYKNAG